MQLVFSGEDSGRMLKYNPKTKETTILVRNLQFPNGVSLSKDGSFLVFCESSIGRYESIFDTKAVHAILRTAFFIIFSW